MTREHPRTILRRWVASATRYVDRVTTDIHQGMIDGLERIWYG